MATDKQKQKDLQKGFAFALIAFALCTSCTSICTLCICTLHSAPPPVRSGGRGRFTWNRTFRTSDKTDMDKTDMGKTDKGGIGANWVIPGRRPIRYRYPPVIKSWQRFHDR